MEQSTERAMRVMASHTPWDSNGNAGMTSILGMHDAVEEAKRDGEMYATTHGHRDLHWRQFSATTWGLMSGSLYTNVLVSICGPAE